MSKADRQLGKNFTVRELERVLFNDMALPEKSRFVVAYSGGRDSLVLLHSMSALRKYRNFDLAAAHFDHGLHDQSSDWASMCRERADQVSVKFYTKRGKIWPGKDGNTEAMARMARYRWLDSICSEDDLVLTAHHGDDQAETFLLHLFAGKHLEQLSGIAVRRPIVHGSQSRLIRPLLEFSRKQIADYAESHQLEWIEDPSNRNPDFYRNFLRHELVPVLYKRGAISRELLLRGAKACKKISAREEEENLVLLKDTARPQKRGIFCIADPVQLPSEIQADMYEFSSLLRSWVHLAGIQSPSNRQFADFFRQLNSNRAGYAELHVAGVFIRYYDGYIFLTRKAHRTREPLIWNLDPIKIEDVGLEIEFQRWRGGLDRDRLFHGDSPELHWRSGGERFTLPNRSHSSSLKKLFQRYRVPPWERNTVPYLWSNGKIVWAHGIGCASGYSGKATETGVIPKISLLAD